MNLIHVCEYHLCYDWIRILISCVVELKRKLFTIEGGGLVINVRTPKWFESGGPKFYSWNEKR